MAKREALDLRPYLARFSAEAIRELEYTVVNGRKKLTRVRLTRDADTAIELAIVDNAYTVTVKARSNGAWLIVSQDTPRVGGKTFNQIPFIHLANEDDEGAPFDELCQKNGEHYLTSSKLEIALNWCAQPKLTIAGLDDDVELDTSPEAVWRFSDPNTKVQYVEFTGAGIESIERKLERLRETMAQIGSRMLTSEKAAAEAAETVARRQASENSILASVARHIGDRVSEALRLLALWEGLDASQIGYSLNTDFVPAQLDAGLLVTLDALHDKNKLTDRELFDALQKGEILSEAVDYEQHQAELETKPIDPPLGE